MKSIALNEIERLPGKRLSKEDTFCFRCHPGLSCFNRCCRNLNLFLYPYDILRLKARLSISSDRFLEDHTDLVLRPGHHFPDVLLRMSDRSERECPFLEASGCSVYPDRPDACRTFPVEQGVIFQPGKAPQMVHFFRPPEFCLGRFEDATWDLASWSEDQEAVTHHRMTLLWSEIANRFTDDPWGGEGPQGPRGKMAFMATYNLDLFRKFVFESSFLKRYKVKPKTLARIRRDETELLGFGFNWVKFFLWGIRTPDIGSR